MKSQVSESITKFWSDEIIPRVVCFVIIRIAYNDWVPPIILRCHDVSGQTVRQLTDNLCHEYDYQRKLACVLPRFFRRPESLSVHRLSEYVLLKGNSGCVQIIC